MGLRIIRSIIRGLLKGLRKMLGILNLKLLGSGITILFLKRKKISIRRKMRNGRVMLEN